MINYDVLLCSHVQGSKSFTEQTGILFHSHSISAQARTTAMAHRWGNLTNIGKQSLPTFNLGEILGLVSDWKAQQMGLSTSVCQLLHHCIKTDLPLLCHTLKGIGVFLVAQQSSISTIRLIKQMLAEFRLKMYTL